MARRLSAFPVESELSLSQTDEIRLRKNKTVLERRRPVQSLSEGEKRRRVWTIYLIGFVDLFGVSIIIPLLPKLTRNLGASPSLAGLIGSVYGALQVFSSPLLGRQSDRYGRKTILLVCYVGPALGYFAMALSGSLSILILSRIPTGILKHGLSISKAYLADITDAKERQAVLGMFNACSSLGFIFGPLLSGYLADWDPSLQVPCLVGGTIFLFDMILVSALVPPLHKDRNEVNGGDATGQQQAEVNGGDVTGEQQAKVNGGDVTGEQQAEVNGGDVTGQQQAEVNGGDVTGEQQAKVNGGDVTGEQQAKVNGGDVTGEQQAKVNGGFAFKKLISSLNIAKGVHWIEIWDLLVFRFLATFAVIMFRTNFSIFVEEHYHVDYKTFGQIISFSGVLSAVASSTCGMISRLYNNSHSKQFIHATVLLALSILFITLSVNVLMLLVLLVPLSIATANLRICMMSLMLKRGREDEKGAIIGLANSTTSVSRMLAPSIVGIVQEFSSETVGYLSAGLAAVTVGMLLFFPIEKEKRT